MEAPIRILHLEDNPNDAELIQSLLTNAGIRCEALLVDARAEFEHMLRQGGFDLILSDYTLPSFDGLTALDLARERCPKVPFIFVSGTLGEDVAVDALKHGATDYILKERPYRLAPAVERALREVRERADWEVRINQLAFYDSLTGLPNRALIEDRLALALAQARRAGRGMALLFFDLDGFKSVNDSLGHAVGDRLLTEVGLRVSRCLREGDTASRWGGDEFVVLLPDLGRRQSEVSQGARHVAEKIREALAAPFAFGPHEVMVTASIGIALFPSDADKAAEIIKQADTAMYFAKEQGRNNIQFYAAHMSRAALERLSLESDLHQAIKRSEFMLLYQPQMDIQSRRITGAEALLRWNHPVRGLLTPDVFIPLAEQSGQIIAIGEWVLQEAMAQLRLWKSAGLDIPRIAINVSPLQFHRPEFVDRVRSVIAHSQLSALCMEIELTEGVLMQDTETVLTTLASIHACGVSLAIDDFGTGYSSLRYLKRLPIDVLKVDQSFVQDLTSDPDAAAIVEAILALARTLKLRVIAEGVETAPQFDFLRRLGCEECQGYYFSAPLTADALAALLLGHAPDRTP